jgi:hypothetical protein
MTKKSFSQWLTEVFYSIRTISKEDKALFRSFAEMFLLILFGLIIIAVAIATLVDQQYLGGLLFIPGILMTLYGVYLLVNED